MKKALSVTIAAFIFTHPAYAFFCPTNYNQINEGDSIEQVEQQCGKPDAKKSYKAEPNAPQEWDYFIKLDPTSQATVKMAIVFDNNQVMNINSNSASLTTTQMCGTTIQIGDSPETIEAACGKPAFINKGGQKGTEDASAAITMTEITYNSALSMTLIFENGKLKGKK